MRYTRAPNPAASEVTTDPPTARRELARTRSSASSTTPGTSDALATACVLEQTRLRKAAGKSSRLWIHDAMSRQAASRPMAAPKMMNRRPPRSRSMAGPTNGPTTAKGRTVQIRPSAVRPRAALSETLTNTDPASATVTRASPAPDRLLTAARPAKGRCFQSESAGPRRKENDRAARTCGERRNDAVLERRFGPDAAVISIPA